jgi:hypothetical protein
MPNLQWLSRKAGNNFTSAEPEPIELGKVPERFTRAVLLGEPGSGKSTCLQQLVLTELDRLEQALVAERPNSPDRDPAFATSTIPFYVSLSDWQDTALSADDFLRSQLESLLTSANYLVRNFDSLVAAGRFLLVMDGLNELPGRKAHRQEGGHEIEGQQNDGLDAFRPRVVGGIDPRERSLRELAQARGLRTRFVMSCRSHEYFDSLRWQVIRVLPMNATQIGRFIETYLESPKAGQLQESMRSNAALADIASNPFFLASIIEIYRPELQLESRGQILTLLLRGSVATEVTTNCRSMPSPRRHR